MPHDYCTPDSGEFLPDLDWIAAGDGICRNIEDFEEWFSVEIGVVTSSPDEPKFNIDSKVVERFTILRDEWKQGTAFSSRLTEILLYPSYQQIVGLGPIVIPLLLNELEKEPTHWLWALFALTGTDQGAGCKTIDCAAEAWLKWGRENGLR